MSNKGTAFVLSGPSGSGKDTVLRLVRERMPELEFSISCVTRQKRGIPQEDEKYSFISVDEFKSRLERGMFLEHNVFVGNYYGTPRQPVEQAIESGKNIVIEIDVNGAAQIRETMPDAVSIFIMPPSFEVLRSRLYGRNTDNEEMSKKRLDEALREISCAKDYDYIIVNDDLQKAVDDMCDIIKASGHRATNMTNFINEVLKNA